MSRFTDFGGRNVRSLMSNAVPLRPLTAGELLDAAVGLLRNNAVALLGSAAVLAAVEQLALYPLRRYAIAMPPYYLPTYDDRSAQYWLLIAVGFATEAVIIALLGGLAATAAGAAVNGRRLGPRTLLAWRGRRVLATVLVAAVVGLIAGLGAIACWLPWLAGYGLLGLAVPVLVVDGRGPLSAVARSAALASRLGLRAARLRLTGYPAWLAVRLALGLGGLTVLSLVLPSTDTWALVAGTVTWIMVNTVSYAMLACLDSVLHLETRMRTEGLDIVAVRARQLGQQVDLAVPR